MNIDVLVNKIALQYKSGKINDVCDGRRLITHNTYEILKGILNLENGYDIINDSVIDVYISMCGVIVVQTNYLLGELTLLQYYNLVSLNENFRIYQQDAQNIEHVYLDNAYFKEGVEIHPYKLFVMNEVPNEYYVKMMELDYPITNMKMTKSQKAIHKFTFTKRMCVVSGGVEFNEYSSYREDIDFNCILWSDLCLLKHIPRVREKFELTVFRFVIADFGRLPDCRFCFV